MKNTILFLILLLIQSVVYSQSAKEMLAEIEGKWQLDNSGNVTFTKVIEVPNTPKDILYTRALSYFTYKYNSGDDVIQLKDKEQGTIIGKGIYSKVHTGRSIFTTVVNTTHILRIDIKDNKIRAMITLQEYLTTETGASSTSIPTHHKCFVSSRYPIAKKDMQKTVMTKAFYKSYLQVQNSFAELEKSLNEGNTGQENNNDW